MRNILSLALPMTLAQLINLLYNIVDRIYIGRLPENSTLAQTGLGLTLPIITIVSAFSYLFGMGGSPLFSIARGRNDDDKAEKIMGNSFTLLLIAGFILSVLGLMFKRPILYLFGASDATFPYANDYIVIYLLGSIFVMICLGMNSFINAQGFGKIGMYSVLIGAITNIVLDPILIFIFRMGVKGAALATIISQFVSALWVLYFLIKKANLKLKLSNMVLEMKLVRKITFTGLSSFIAAITSSAVQIIVNANLQQYGGDLYVGVMTVINSIREIIQMPVSGITNGAQPVMGYNYGARAYDRVRSSIKFLAIVCISYTIIIWGIVMLFPPFFIKIFNQNPELIQAALPALRIYFSFFFMMSFQFSGQSVFVALGKPKYAVFFSMLRKAVIVIPLTLILPKLFNLGIYGMFLAEPISDIIGGIACFATMLLTVWPELKNKK